MKRTFIALLFTLSSFIAYAQWDLITPAPTSEDLFSVSFADKNVGYCVGAHGIILKTTDSGISWQVLTSGVSESLNSVYFPSPDTGYAAGNAGTLLVTCNGGNTWFAAQSGTSGDLTSVFFTSPTTGYAAELGGAVLKTMDGGITWEKQQISSGQLHSLFFTGSNNGFAAGSSGTVVQTEDQGQSWAGQSWDSKPISSLFFADAQTGFGLLQPSVPMYCQDYCWMEILKTTNGGQTWVYQSDTALSMVIMKDLHFTNPQSGYAVGNYYGGNGVIFHTNDGGLSWDPQSIVETPALHSVCFTDAFSGFAVGNAGTILVTRTGGINSTEQNPEKGEMSLIRPNPARGFVTLSNAAFSTQKVGISVYDISGALMLKRDAEREAVICLDVNSLLPGLYSVKIQFINRVEVRKLIIQ